MTPLTIAGLARQGGVGVETVRFYQRRGLLAAPARPNHGGYRGIRHYGEGDVRRLRFVRAAQAAGFTLEEIRELLDLDATDDHPRAHALAQARIAALDARIAELGRARDALGRLAAACAGGAKGPCPILTAFEEGRSDAT